ncbi:MAG: uroporphyrinogen-III C-methyltransferase [Burkholderiaceae bacterium]
MNERSVDPAAAAEPARAAAVDASGPVNAANAANAANAPDAPAAPASASTSTSRWVVMVAGALALMALLVGALTWQKLSNIQEQLARQSADSGAQAIEARTLARQAVDATRDATARLSVLETRLAEVALQRTQLEELMQSLSRSRDENLVVDIEAAIRLGQQQSQLTGSVEPLLAALRSADQRLARSAQPRLTRVRAALARDIDRIKSANLVDVPSMLVRLDELARQVDDMLVANAVAGQTAAPARTAATAAAPAWAERAWAMVMDELRALVRVSRVDHPDAVLLAPEQAFFLRENLKLKLLNARLGLLARQTDSVRADLAAASAAVTRYFDAGSRRNQSALATLQQLQSQARAVEVPRVDETLAALAAAAAGR